MTASSRGSKAMASLIRSSRQPRICTSCITTLSQRTPLASRGYAVAASTTHASDAASIPPLTSTSSDFKPATPPYITKSGILLSRPPILTRPLSPFEESYFFYQKRLNERLAMPFSRYFYFKKDTPADVDWKRKAKDRNGSAARELGGYQAYGEWGWNDELLVGDKTSTQEALVEALVQDAVPAVVEGESVDEAAVVERPLQRKTDADTQRDLKRLDRALDRTLYLVVKYQNRGWQLPSGSLEGKENLHQAAERILVQTAGMNMNTWIVGHVPVGHIINKPQYKPESTTEVVAPGDKTFFMKGRIMAGQANLEGNVFGTQDFRWLTREELQKAVGPRYWSWVRNMIAER